MFFLADSGRPGANRLTEIILSSCNYKRLETGKCEKITPQMAIINITKNWGKTVAMSIMNVFQIELVWKKVEGKAG